MGKDVEKNFLPTAQSSGMKATWKGKTIAQSYATKQVEGNEYFPPESVNQKYLKRSSTRTTCAWKGIASYYHLEVGDETNRDAAWYYPNPLKAALKIRNHIAFWKGVEVTNE